MAIIELRGKTETEAECDLMEISVCFEAKAENPYDCSVKVMEECERFLSEIEKSGVALNTIIIDRDNIDVPSYREEKDYLAQRSIIIRKQFDMDFLNFIKKVLQDGKYIYDFDVDFEVSDEEKYRFDMIQTVLTESQKEAEKIAESLGLKLIGLKGIEQPGWNEIVRYKRGEEDPIICCCGTPYEKSSQLKANTKDIEIDILMKWEIG